MKNKFKRLLKQIVIALIFLIGLLNFSACKPSNPFVETPITGATIIDTREQEFPFNKPFKPTKQVVKVCFEYTDKLNAYSISESPNFPDGMPLKLTASVIDQNGKKYDLTHIANSVENYLCLRPELTNKWMNISKKDVAFVKLLVYSNRRINVSKIQWVSFNTWDI